MVSCLQNRNSIVAEGCLPHGSKEAERDGAKVKNTPFQATLSGAHS